MAQNTGTLVGSAIRPNDSNDPIASAYAEEIKGGLHFANDLATRDAIIPERRNWGMLCYVISENKTYQLEYDLQDTTITNNSNWTEFSGSGGGGGSEWLDSVLSVELIEPTSPNNGDRYLAGLSSNDITTGTNWDNIIGGVVVEWNASLSRWNETEPTDGTSVRVDNEDGSIYKYEGDFPNGQWEKEQLGQIRKINATTANGVTYEASSLPTTFESYLQDMVFLTDFNMINSGTSSVTIDINELGPIQIKKPTRSGLKDLDIRDIEEDIVYQLIFDGTYFQLIKPNTDLELFGNKYLVEEQDYIIIPHGYQYWIYGDITIEGELVNNGQLFIANGSMVLQGGTFSNNGQLSLINLEDNTTSYNDSDTIEFSTDATPGGLSVSSSVIDGSLTASKLDTGINGGATAGYILSVDSSGFFNWVESIDIDTENGIEDNNGVIGLGGTLSRNTNIDGFGYKLDINNLGEFNIDSGTAGGQIATDGNLTLTAGEQLGLVSNSGAVSILNGEGLVYDGDYSLTFITHSLVDKNYVDSLGVSKNSFDDKNFIVSATISNDNSFTGLTISGTPLSDSYISVFVNGIEYELGYGSINSTPFYFSDDGGVTAKDTSSNLIETGDGLYYNESLGFGSIDPGFRISLLYIE